MSTRTEATGVIAGFTCLGILITYPLILRLGTHLPNGDPVLTAWTLAWDADRILHGFRGIWDAPNFFPYRHTLLYSDHLLGIALFTAPLQWLTNNPVLVYNVAYLASFPLSGGGMYLLVRSLLGRRDVALVAGAVYACQPFRVAHAAHLQWLMTGWLPLSLWALHRYFSTRRLRDLVASAAFFLLQSLTASYFTYFTLLPLIIVGIAELVRRRPPLVRTAAHVAVATMFVALAILPIVLAYTELRRENGLRRSVREIAIYSADVRDYVSAGSTLRIWNNLGTGRAEHELFPGAMALSLAIVAIVVRPRSPVTVTYALIAVAAFLLSLGPQPTYGGRSLGFAGPYALLLRIVPGLDGLRAPARLAVVVQAALAVLSAVGAAWLLDRLASRQRVASAVITSAIVAVVAAEGWPENVRISRFYLEGDPRDRLAYAHLKALPAGAVMELPTSVERYEPEFTYQYMTIVHRHPVVNGHSGYKSPLIMWWGSGHSPLQEVDRQRDALMMLRSVGVRYVVVHRWLYQDRSVLAALDDAIRRSPDQVVSYQSFGETMVVALAPLELPAMPSRTALIPSTTITATATHSAERLPLLFDGDRESRWLTGGPQSGTEAIRLDLATPRDVAVVRIQMGSRSFGDYPRDLSIEAIGDGGSRVLYRGTVLPQFARGLLNDAEYPYIDIVLPPNRTRTLQLRQLGTTHGFFWSIHELQLLERLP